MKTIKLLAIATLFASASTIAEAKTVAHFSMDVSDGKICETVSGDEFEVQGHFTPENVPGAVGKALRFDGYTSYIDASLGDIIATDAKQMTVSVWVAAPCYPIIEIDKDTKEQTAIVSCLDESTRTGFGFYLGFNGKWSFRTYIGGWPVNLEVSEPLPTYQWNCLTAVIDTSARSIKLYNNGTEMASGRANGAISMNAGAFTMGHGTLKNYMGPFLLSSFNGLIDDITISDEAIPAETIAAMKPENPADLSIPTSRYAEQLLRPRFHGMPATAWTNECHGMYYSDGRFHLFFQKNANGPYMARLHWGHLTSTNLFDWKEDKIAIAPGAAYDIKGCWSGCVFSDEAITGGKPNILYTAVDYVKASIAQAVPTDETLADWEKKSNNPIIQGRPNGLSDDFRDPYFFRHGDNAYIIVGSSKNGKGTTTLHKYNSATGGWSNDGATFFNATNAASEGTFWEMPAVCDMDNRWLFTATPLGLSTGVRSLYWTGSINNAGEFVPESNFASPKNIELVAREGFGLLSPTIYKHEGKTIALGIVPDKLPSQDNWELGWAHCYSLPREWSLDADGNLRQKPYEGLAAMRSAVKFAKNDFELTEAISLTPVEGREAEILGIFKVGKAPFGFNIFKNDRATGSITYNPSLGELTLDFSNLERMVNDAGVFNGVYRCTLPEIPGEGETLKLNVFIDHSIVDIFINDRWASSVRVFPTAADANGIEAFSNGTTDVEELKAWTLSKEGDDSGVDDVIATAPDENATVNVYHVSGALVKSNVLRTYAKDGLEPGIYIIDRKKVIVH